MWMYCYCVCRQEIQQHCLTSDFLACSLNGQTKEWLQRGPLAFIYQHNGHTLKGSERKDEDAVGCNDQSYQSSSKQNLHDGS